MRREGVGIIEVLIVLALGVGLAALGVRFLSGAGHQAVASATGAENLGLANELADVFRKRLGEYEVVDVRPGATSTQFTAIAAPPSWAGGGEVVSLSGSELTVRFSPSFFSALAGDLRPGQFAYLSLPQQKLIFATAVSGIDQGNRQVTFTLPPSCFPRGIQIAGSQVFAKPAITLDVRALPSPPFLSIQGGLRFDANNLNIPDLRGGVSFSYVFLTQGGGQFTLTDLPSYPTTQVTQNGQTGFLSRIAISSQISRTGNQGTRQGAEGSALSSIPVRPVVTSCATPTTPGATSGFTVVVSGPANDSFFAEVYSNAPENQKVVVTIGGSPNVIPSLGTYDYRVPSGAGVDLGAISLTASENLPSGERVSYRFDPDPLSTTFPPDSFSPIFPNSVSVTYRLVPGSVRITLSNLPSGATWGVNASPTEGRYAQSGSLLGQTSSRATLQLLPGAYNLSFPEVALQRQVTISGNTVTYTALYPVTPSPPSVVLSSGQTVDVSASVSSSPRAGTLTISREPTNVPGTFEIYDAQGALVQTVNIPSSQASDSINLAPGGYRIVAKSVQVSGDWYDPASTEAVVGVSSNQTASVSFTYTIRPSTLQINMSGLPEGQALIYVNRNDTQIATLQGSGTVSITTPPGQVNTYTVSPQDVIYGGKYYQGTASPPSVQGKSGGDTYTVNVTYVPYTTQPPPGSGVLDLNISCIGSGCSYFNPLVCVFLGDYGDIPNLNGNTPLLRCKEE
jgi:hypothetical protein